MADQVVIDVTYLMADNQSIKVTKVNNKHSDIKCLLTGTQNGILQETNTKDHTDVLQYNQNGHGQQRKYGLLILCMKSKS